MQTGLLAAILICAGPLYIGHTNHVHRGGKAASLDRDSTDMTAIEK